MVWNYDAANAGFTAGKPWLPDPAAHVAAAVDVQERDGGSVLAWYRRVLEQRQGSEALRAGTLRFLPSNADVLLFERRSGDEAILCGFNFADREARMRRPAGAEAVLLSVGEHSIGAKTLTLAGRWRWSSGSRDARRSAGTAWHRQAAAALKLRLSEVELLRPEPPGP